jgi:Cap4 dsDNA endonuclease
VRGAEIDVEHMSAPDAGGETQRRFRYQINYTALKALQILKAGSDVSAVYCEHLEDLLVEHSDGGLTGIQVKSRELDQKPFRSSDASVRNALIRFCVRAAGYPGRFRRFILATNFVFFTGDGAEDVRNILKRCRDNPRHEGIGTRDKIVAYLKAVATGPGATARDSARVRRELAGLRRSKGLATAGSRGLRCRPLHDRPADERHRNSSYYPGQAAQDDDA